MKRLILALVIAISSISAFASDNQPCTTCTQLKPVTVYRGKTVTVQKHYDVYQPKIVYEKVKSYTTTQTRTSCEQ